MRDGIVVADLFSAHQSLINEVYCDCKYGAGAPVGMQFLRWLSFSATIDQAIPLVPDGYVEFAGATASLAAFLEVDLAHERLSVWLGKVRNYLQYAASSRFETEFGGTRFLVLVVCNSQGRMESLRTATARLTEKIFRFATFPSVKQQGLWSAIWFKPTGCNPKTLIEIP